MCFIVEDINSGPKVATEDIPCKKGLMNYGTHNWRSPYRHARYVFIDGVCKKFLNGKLHREGAGAAYIIEAGLHTYTVRRASLISLATCDQIMLDAIIPKGATYYQNDEYGEYVSDRLVVFNKEEG